MRKHLWNCGIYFNSFCLNFRLKRLIEDMMTVFICLESSSKEEEEFVFFLSGIQADRLWN